MDAALARIEQASLIDPLSAETHATAGRLLLFARRYPDAAARLRTALRIEPRFPAARKLLSDTLWHGGFQSDAHTAFLDWLAAVDVPATELTVVEATLRRDGLPGLWRTQLQRPDKPGAHPGLAFKRAAMLAGLGQVGPAIDALEAAASQRDAGVIFISVDPQFDAVAAAPRFQALLGRVGLPL
jgi:tetratricopeptide (TPR) repeat protein